MIIFTVEPINHDQINDSYTQLCYEASVCLKSLLYAKLCSEGYKTFKKNEARVRKSKNFYQWQLMIKK